MVNSRGRFAWYELLTSDVEGAKDFYANVVGWNTRDASSPGMTYVLFTVGEIAVAGLMRPAERRDGRRVRRRIGSVM